MAFNLVVSIVLKMGDILGVIMDVSTGVNIDVHMGHFFSFESMEPVCK